MHGQPSLGELPIRSTKGYINQLARVQPRAGELERMLSQGCHWAFWALSDPCCEVAELRGDSWLDV